MTIALLGTGLLGSAIGCALNFGMGHAVRSGWERFKHIQIDEEHSRIARLRQATAVHEKNIEALKKELAAPLGRPGRTVTVTRRAARPSM
jgi:hypothetical protein